MSLLSAAKVIRRVRQRLELSQEALSRLLNATKGAVQHWERGRNNPDLARILALRQLCPPGAERKELDGLIRQLQAEVAPVPGLPTAPSGKKTGGRRSGGLIPAYPESGWAMLRRENARLRRQVEKIQGALGRRNEQMRILQDLASELRQEMAELRASLAGKTEKPKPPVATPPRE
jgi:transcriptional regulator with XRE-family HTH domain